MAANVNRLHVDIMSVHCGVTGSCNVCVANLPNNEKFCFIVDCGLFQERESFLLNKSFPFNENEIEFVLVTHNHVDHIGRLPLLCKKGFHGKIYATRATTKLLPKALYDSHRVLRNLAKRKNEKALYGEKDVKDVLNLLKPIDYEKSYNVNKYTKVTFFYNGHLIGAAMILVQIKYPGYDDINLLFTGDYNNKNVFFHVRELPYRVRKLPISIIQEATYGYMDSSEIKEVFRDNILQAIENEKSIICPVYSLGRAQEVLYELKRMQDSNCLDRQIPIRLDGKLSIGYTEMFKNDEDLNIDPKRRNFLPTNFDFVTDESRGVYLYDFPKVILTSSGSGYYGPAPIYILEYIKRENALIHFTGFSPEGTLGHKLKNTKKGEYVVVRGLSVKRMADVEYTSEFSAHAKADEMINFLKQFDKLNFVAINHGEKETKEIFAKRINKEVHPKNVGILGDGYLFRINAYGVIKTVQC